MGRPAVNLYIHNLTVSADHEAIILRDNGRIVWAWHVDEGARVCGFLTPETAAEVRKVMAETIARRGVAHQMCDSVEKPDG